MSMLLRRSVQRAVPRGRRFASDASEAAKNKFYQERAAEEAHAAETSDLWRKISYYVCIPGIAVCGIWTYKLEKDHAAHEEHLKHENDGKLPQPPAYEYLNVRHRPFPWGMNSLFFNPEVQKDLTAEE